MLKWKNTCIKNIINGSDEMLKIPVLRISSMEVMKCCWPFQDVIGNGPQIYVYMKSKILEA